MTPNHLVECATMEMRRLATSSPAARPIPGLSSRRGMIGSYPILSCWEMSPCTLLPFPKVGHKQGTRGCRPPSYVYPTGAHKLQLLNWAPLLFYCAMSKLLMNIIKKYIYAIIYKTVYIVLVTISTVIS